MKFQNSNISRFPKCLLPTFFFAYLFCILSRKAEIVRGNNTEGRIAYSTFFSISFNLFNFRGGFRTVRIRQSSLSLLPSCIISGQRLEGDGRCAARPDSGSAGSRANDMMTVSGMRKLLSADSSMR